MRGNKWTKSVLKATKEYAESADRPNISGLSKALGVSRQCIYDWMCHEEFRLVLNEMRHCAIDGSYKAPIPQKATDRDRKRTTKLEVLKEKEEVFVDELGDDEEWEFDD